MPIQPNFLTLQVCQRSEGNPAAILSHISIDHSAEEKAAAEERRVYVCKRWTLQWIDNDFSMRFATF